MLTMVAAALAASLSASPAHGMWVYPSGAFTAPAERRELLAFARSRGVAELYVTAAPGLTGGPGADPRGFHQGLAEATAAGVAVEILAGDPAWLGEPAARAWFFQQLLGPVLDLARSSRPPLRLHLDLEPHQLPCWESASPEARLELLQQTFALFREIRTRATAARVPLELAADIPLWWDAPELTFTFDGIADTAYGHTLREIEHPVLMAYVRQPETLIARLEPLLARAKAAGRRVRVAVETDPAPGLKELAAQSEVELLGLLNTVDERFATHAGYGGWAVHAYPFWRALPFTGPAAGW